jgi:hypothetical protein
LNTELPPPPYVENSYLHRVVERLFQMSPQVSSIDIKDSNSSAVSEKYIIGNESQHNFPWNSAIFLAALIICGVIGYWLFGSQLTAFSQAAMGTTPKPPKKEPDLAECQHVHGDRDHADFCGVKSHNVDFTVGQRPNPQNVDFTIDQRPNSPSDVLRQRRPQTARPVQEAAGTGVGSESNSMYLESRSAVSSGRDNVPDNKESPPFPMIRPAPLAPDARRAISREPRSNKKCARCRQMRLKVCKQTLIQ